MDVSSDNNNNNKQRSQEKDDLEAAFGHIQKGNDHEKQNDFWKACSEFQKAHLILLKLGNELSQQVVAKEKETKHNDTIGVEDENLKIVKLYQMESTEYFHRSRKALLSAMTAEYELDDVQRKQQQQPQKVDETPLNFLLSSCLADTVAHDRLELFSHLFARDYYSSKIKSIHHGDNNTDDEAKQEDKTKDITNLQASLEERLMSLNESLPKGFKTSEERMSDINRGLNRLGFSLYSAADVQKQKIEPQKSHSDQVNEIITQAHDEVALGATATTISKNGVQIATSTSTDDDVDSLSHDLESTDDDDDTVDDDDEPDMNPEKIIALRDSVVEAQTQLAQLIALLEFDEGGDAEIQFCRSTGKQFLKEARKNLLNAAKTWNSQK